MENLINWLLEEKEPSVKYRTLTELLGKTETDPEVSEAKVAVLQSKNVNRLFDRLDDRELFPHISKYYGNFTTFNYLYALAELGLKKGDPHIDDIVDWILIPGEDKHEHFVQKEFQNEHAYLLDESNLGSCRQTDFLGTLLRLGFGDDERVKKLIDAFIEKNRFDGGYLCKWKKSRHKGQTPKSCVGTTVNALRVFSYLPEEYRNTDAYKNTLEYFVSRNMIHSKINSDEIICSTNAFYNGCGMSHAFVLADAMSRLGRGNIPEMDEVWAILESKRDTEGKVILEATDTKKTLIMDGVGKPNKYLTLNLLLSYRLKELAAE